MRWLLVFVAATAALAADVADMSGSWTLNVAKSKWHRMAKPASATLTMELRESKLKYELNSIDAAGKAQSGTFDGAMDGKENDGITVTRLSPLSVSVVRKIDDGLGQEFTFTITQDGQHLVRRIQSGGPNGKATWTELYDRQQP